MSGHKSSLASLYGDALDGYDCDRIGEDMAEAPRVVETGNRRLLALRVHVRWSEISEVAMTALERVWACIRDNSIRGYGHSVFLYENASRDGADMSMGVEVPRGVEAPDGFVIAETPAGHAATATHTGSYDGLAAATRKLIDWCTERQLEPTGTSWEVYGDWDDDPAKVDTEIYLHLKP